MINVKIFYIVFGFKEVIISLVGSDRIGEKNLVFILRFK